MNDPKNQDVLKVFESYPAPVREKLHLLRELIIETARETGGVGDLEETLKWGEPSYIAKQGSTIRMGWHKPKIDKNRYALYFHCQTTLVDTFKTFYGDLFVYEGNRAIIFNVNDEIPVKEIKICISLSLTYHRIKQLPMLGL